MNAVAWSTMHYTQNYQQATSNRRKIMNKEPLLVFVCEHGAAKSIVASTLFNKLASDKGLALKSIARGRHPDNELSKVTVAGLQADGLTPTETVPQKLTVSDLESAQITITFCNLSDGEYHRAVKVEHWDNIPAVSDGYEVARDTLLNRINLLLSKQELPESQM